MGNDLFVLNGTTLAAIGGLLGALAGAIAFLTRQLLTAKDEQVKAAGAERDRYREERDYFRDQVKLRDRLVERASDTASEATMLAQRATLAATKE